MVSRLGRENSEENVTYRRVESRVEKRTLTAGQIVKWRRGLRQQGREQSGVRKSNTQTGG